MNVRTTLSICLICCLAVLVIGCTLTRSGKAARDAQKLKEAEQAKQLEQTKQPIPDKKWEHYGADTNGVDYYFQKESIAFPSENLVRVWRKRTFRQRSELKEIISFDEIDCKTEKYRSSQTQGVRQDGSTTEMFVKPSPWITIYQGSADEYFLDTSCKEAKKGK